MLKVHRQANGYTLHTQYSLSNKQISPIREMFDWTNFDAVFEKAAKWTYEQGTMHTISKTRQNMEGVLFFDRVWGSLGLKEGP
jgi:hypothetical protein